jgi:type II secretory pathway component PulF
MSLVVTPGHYADRAHFYHQLSQLTNAGIGLPQALQSQLRAPPSRFYRRPLAHLVQKIEQGSTFAESVMSFDRDWMPPFDVALLAAGEKSGRLPACFKLLADYYQERAHIARQVVGDLLYPALLFHFAALVWPFHNWPPPNLLQAGGMVAHLRSVAFILVPAYAILVLLIVVAQGKYGERWRSIVESVTYAIPLIGSARRSLALARLSAALEALINAGVTIIEAWELAAAASGSLLFRRTVAGWRPSLETGSTPAEMVVASGKFPELFCNLYSSGEVSGKVDQELGHLNSYYHEQGTRQLRTAAQASTRLIYFGIVVMVAYVVINFWANYFGQIGEILGGG